MLLLALSTLRGVRQVSSREGAVKALEPWCREMVLAPPKPKHKTDAALSRSEPASNSLEAAGGHQQRTARGRLLTQINLTQRQADRHQQRGGADEIGCSASLGHSIVTHAGTTPFRQGLGCRATRQPSSLPPRPPRIPLLVGFPFRTDGGRTGTRRERADGCRLAT